MAEPKIDHFLSMLADKNFQPVALKDNLDNMAEVLWYIDPERAKGGEVVNKLIESPESNEVKTEERRKQIITNLAKLYPLSQNLVLNILRNVDYSDDAFLVGFDLQQKVKQQIKSIMDKVKDRRGKLTGDVSRYTKEMEQLNAEKEELLQSADEHREARERLENLRSEVERLQQETDVQEMKRRTSEYESEKNRLEAELARQKDEQNKRSAEIEHLARELEAIQDRLDPGDETRMLRDLLRHFPKDTEDSQ